MVRAQSSTTHAAALGLLIAVCLGSPASAQSIEGEWTHTPSTCGHYSVNNDNIRIAADGYGILESFCSFTGGTKQSSTHWLMKAVCIVEGGGEQPEMSVDLEIIDGKLRVIEGGDTFYYESRCALPDAARD